MKPYTAAQRIHDNEEPDFYFADKQDAYNDGIEDAEKSIIKYLENQKGETIKIADLICTIERREYGII